MRDLQDFWRVQDSNPVPFEAAVQRAQDTLDEEGWKCLIAAVEGLLLRETMQHMLGLATTPLDLDKHLGALKLASLAHSAPTDQLVRRRAPRRRPRDVPAGTAWGPRELECLMQLSTQGLTPDTVPPTCRAALRVLALCKLGLAMALARRARASTKTTPPTDTTRAQAVSAVVREPVERRRLGSGPYETNATTRRLVRR